MNVTDHTQVFLPIKIPLEKFKYIQANLQISKINFPLQLCLSSNNPTAILKQLKPIFKNKINNKILNWLLKNIRSLLNLWMEQLSSTINLISRPFRKKYNLFLPGSWKPDLSTSPISFKSKPIPSGAIKTPSVNKALKIWSSGSPKNMLTRTSPSTCSRHKCTKDQEK